MGGIQLQVLLQDYNKHRLKDYNIQVYFDLVNVDIVFELGSVNTVKFESWKHLSALINGYQLAVENEEELQMWG